MKFLLSLMMLWGLAVVVSPWLIDTGASSETAADMIVSGIGLAIIGSAVALWRQTS